MVAVRVVLHFRVTLPGRDALELAVALAFVTMAQENQQQLQDVMLEEFERDLNNPANAALGQATSASQTSTLSREWESVSVNAPGVTPTAASAAPLPHDPWHGKA